MFKNQIEFSVRKLKNPIYPPGGILKVASLKINTFWPLATNNMHKKFEIVITKANSSYAPETMPPTESRYRKIQNGCQVDILKVTLLKINMPQAKNHSHKQYANEQCGVEIPWQIWVTSRNHVVNRRTDGKVNPVSPRQHSTCTISLQFCFCLIVMPFCHLNATKSKV